MAEEKCKKVVYMVSVASMADMVGKPRDYERNNEIIQIDATE
jgi:hypothetical protein